MLKAKVASLDLRLLVIVSSLVFQIGFFVPLQVFLKNILEFSSGFIQLLGIGVRVAMERKPCVFVSVREQLELLDCISRVSEGSELTALQRLGQTKVIAPVQVDVLVQQWGKTLDVLVPKHVARGA